MTKPILEKEFVKQWKDTNMNILTTMFPLANRNKLSEFLDNQIIDNVKSSKATLHNNYVHKKIEIDLIDIPDWIKDKSPIVAGNGTFFRNQYEVINPAAQMLDNFLKLRKSFKNKLYDYPEDSYEWATYNRLQLTEKINANSYYGVSGSPTSNFFNIYAAASVTSTGQSLISTTETMFEAFMANNIKFIDLNDCMNFLENIRNEKNKFSTGFLPNITVEMVMKRLKDTFFKFKEEYEDALFFYVMGLSEEELTRIYYKNNIYAFSYTRKIRGMLADIISKTSSFKDPNKIPKEITKEMELLWDYYKEFVFYNHFAFNRIQRLKNDKRKSVVVVDTDSNMLNLEPWFDFCMKYIVDVQPDIIGDKSEDDLMYVIVNIVSYLLTMMITDALKKYTKVSNVPKEFRPKINMKNEYLFTRLILCDKKKKYLSSIRLKEGKEINPELTDIKGHQFRKSSIREETAEFLTRLCKEKILDSSVDISIPNILRELDGLQTTIMDSLQNGEKRFLIPKSVKEVGAYSDPFKEQGFRAVAIWNNVYPGNTIELPEKIDIVKVNLETIEDAAPLKISHPDIYKRLEKYVYNSKVEKLRDKGVGVIAIPRNTDSVPEWIIPYIDFDTICNDNIKSFHPVLKALGVEPLRTSKKDYFSNVISF